jgi:hypothetical protein
MMKSILLVSATAMAGLMSAAGAQDQSTPGATSVESVLGGRSAADLICRDISGLSSDEVRGVLHYVRGYEEGRMKATTTLGTSGSGGSTGVAADAPGTESASPTADAEAAGVSPEITGSTTGSGLAVSSGYRDIAVEQITAACTASPDTRLAEVIHQSADGTVAPR